LPTIPTCDNAAGEAPGDDGLLAFTGPALPTAGMQDGSSALASLFASMQTQIGALLAPFLQMLPHPARASAAPGGAGLAGGAAVCGPVNGIVSGRFGESRPGHPHGHRGTDIAAAAGSPISAVRAGTISFAGWQRGYGLCVQVDHGGGTSTFYAHCSRLNVRVGQAVGAGACIAKVGSTGHSTGPHLHFELREHGTAVNPAGLLALARPRTHAA
jgi:murein DD-endopeptidase MepM/ murein hydrolase activator NlpD